MGEKSSRTRVGCVLRAALPMARGEVMCAMFPCLSSVVCCCFSRCYLFAGRNQRFRQRDGQASNGALTHARVHARGAATHAFRTTTEQTGSRGFSFVVLPIHNGGPLIGQLVLLCPSCPSCRAVLDDLHLLQARFASAPVRRKRGSSLQDALKRAAPTSAADATAANPSHALGGADSRREQSGDGGRESKGRESAVVALRPVRSGGGSVRGAVCGGVPDVVGSQDEMVTRVAGEMPRRTGARRIARQVQHGRRDPRPHAMLQAF